MSACQSYGIDVVIIKIDFGYAVQTVVYFASTFQQDEVIYGLTCAKCASFELLRHNKYYC